MTSQTILDTALAAHAAGISVIPIRPADDDGDKRPAVSWKTYQKQLATETQIRTWFTSGAYGLGVVTGTVSNNLIMLELEGRAAHKLGELTTLATDTGLGDLWTRVLKGCLERTPSGGWHIYIHLNLEDGQQCPGNTKFALNTSREVLAESRGEGGYSVVAPTPGTFHHTGQSWTLMAGTLATAAHVTLDEYDDLTVLLGTLDEREQVDTPQVATYRSEPALRDPHAGISPGDDYEDRTSWAEILTPHGWTAVFTRGTETFWRRPGKNTGISASTGHADDRDRLYIWTTSTDLPSETPLTKFGAYALLEHNGDYSKAAKHLHAHGYGRQAEHPRDPAGLDTFIANKTSNDKTVVVAEGVLTNEPDNEGDVETVEPVIYTRTDDGNALRFADTYQNQLIYIPQLGTWAVWNGHRYDPHSGDETAIQRARQLARTLPQDDKADQNHRNRALSKNGVTNMLYLARNDERMWQPLTNFDSDPYLLNTPTGTINLQTGHLTPHTRPGLYLRSTTIAPQQGPAPLWHRFLDQTFLSDTELITYMQRAFGLSLIGTVLEQVFFLMHGQGANGKTTLMNIIQEILGIGENGYTQTLPSEMFLSNAGNRHPTELASLVGVRIVVTPESEEGKKFNEARMKQLTGKDPIAARRMHQDFFTFNPSHSVYLPTNHEPNVTAGGSAFWRRMNKIPFLNVVPKDQRNPNLEKELLEAEGPQILQWMIDGCLDYLKNGLNPPDAVVEATQSYELEQDTVRQFLNEACTIAQSDAAKDMLQLRVAELRNAYERWCEMSGLEPVGSKTLTQRLATFGIHSTQGSKGVRYYKGVQVNMEAADGLNEVL